MNEPTNQVPGNSKRVLETEEIVIKDANGAVCMRLGLDEKGIPGLRFLGSNGNKRMELVLEDDRVPALAMFHEDGQHGALLRMEMGNSPELKLQGYMSEVRIKVDGSDGGSSVILANEAIGTIVLDVDINTKMVGVSLYHADADVAGADLWLDPEGEATLRFDDGAVNLSVKGLEIDQSLDYGTRKSRASQSENSELDDQEPFVDELKDGDFPPVRE